MTGCRKCVRLLTWKRKCLPAQSYHTTIVKTTIFCLTCLVNANIWESNIYEEFTMSHKIRTERVEVFCCVCGRLFDVKPAILAAGQGKYCSRECMQDGKRNPRTVICHTCGMEFETTAYMLKHGMANKCKSCHSLWKKAKRRVKRYCLGYAEWRRRVYGRDEYTCQHCGSMDRNNLNAHHIIPFSCDESLRTEISNGITLCVKCHVKEHKRLKKMLNSQTDFFIVG